MMEKILTANFEVADSHKLSVYESNGGYGTLAKLFKMKPGDVIEEVKKSAIRGRGGAGFPAGLKWSFVPKDSPKARYLVVNADEGEPGTFKDRYIMELDPHKLLEGMIICSYAIDCHHAYVYVRGEFVYPQARLQAAIDEAYKNGYLGKNIKGSGFNLEVTIHRGAGAYICGEETALLNSIEGLRGMPRIKPPFPAVVGLFGCPTVINNVETLASLPYILEKGGDHYAKIGTEKSTGTKMFSVSGHVNKPGIYEIPMGYPLKKLLMEDCGGIRNGKKLKAVIIGGSSVPVLNAEDALSTNLDYESVAEKGSMLGSGGMIVMDEDTDMVKALTNLAHFYSHESCGQCSPCREGTGWAHKLLKRIVAGEGRPEDLDTLTKIADNMAGKTICVLADGLSMPIWSYLKNFREEFEAYVRG